MVWFNRQSPGKVHSAGIVVVLVVMLAIVIGSVTSPLAGSQPENTLTPEHIAQLQYVTEAAVSPDGRLVAFAKRVQRNPFTEENGSAWVELHVTDFEGNARPYIMGAVKISSVQFTPDGQFISYLSERDDDTVKALYIIPVDGGESQKVIQVGCSITGYTWAPDSRRVAFLSKPVVLEAIEDLKDKGFEQKVYEEDIRDVKVWVYDRLDPETEPRDLGLEGTASEIHWSSDGSMLALALAPTSLIDDKYMLRRVHMVDPESGEVISRFENPGKLGQMAWSPDGAHLALISAVDKNDPKDGELWLATAATGELKPIVAGINGHVSRVAWTDDETLMYLLDQNVHTTVISVRLDGSKEKTIVPHGRPVFRKLYLSDDRKHLVLIGSDRNHDSELFGMKLGGEPERLTNCNPWLDDIRLAPQEVIKYSARDGLELEGMLIHPLDEEPGKRYPLILQVHGGPEAHRRDGWLTWYSSPGQMAAARGFAVFVVNYRGSTGRGVEFSKMGQAGYAEGEFNDLVDAVNHLVEMGLVDEDRVGVTGGSYGGYASAWCATALSEHFAASVMGFGVSDLISKFGTTDIPNEMYLVHAQSWPWERWQWYLEQSPIYHVQEAKTPILILHGEDDTRVHPSQSMELHRYLKTVGNAPVRMVMYPDEKHGMSKAASRYDYSLRQIRWMEYYLMGPGGEMPPLEVDYSAMEGCEDAGE